MTRLARRASLLVAFCLLTSTATAYAECAWVLWLNTEGRTPSEWIVMQAFLTRKDCIAGMHKAINEMPTTFKGATITEDTSGGSYIAITRDQKSSRIGTCLPDTVDPRGPKRQ